MQYTDSQKRLAVVCLYTCGYFPYADELINDWREYSDAKHVVFITNYCNVFSIKNGECRSVILNVLPDSERAHMLMELWGAFDSRTNSLDCWKRLAGYVRPRAPTRRRVFSALATSVVRFHRICA
jgi:hypothetical protein